MMLLHDVSLTALAGAVLTLGLVMLLELRSFNRVRRSVDINLGRVFEQLEMLRAESRSMLEAQASSQAQAQAAALLAAAPVVAPSRALAGERQTIERPLSPAAPVERPAVEPTALDFVVAPPIDNDAYLNASTLAARGLTPEEIAARCGLPAGEARLLASLASARGRREPPRDDAATDAIEPSLGARSAAGSARG
jgi:hypothetical protein